MPVLETAAIAGLLGAYIDSRTGIVKDMAMTGRVIGVGAAIARSVLTGQINAFYQFERWANSEPNHEFIVYPEPIAGSVKEGTSFDELFVVKRYTYKQGYDLVLKYSDVLYHDYGVRPGHTVAMDFVNKEAFIWMWLALWNLGAVPAFINYNLQGHSLEHCVRAANCSLIVVDDEVEDNVKASIPVLAKENVKTVIHNRDFLAKVDAAKGFRLPDDQRPKVELRDPACYIYTSGTTGLPKAAVMSWKKAALGSRVYSAITFLNPSDVVYSAMPLYHSTAAVLGFLSIMNRGGTYAIGHKFSTTTFWTQVKLSNATVIQYVGETCRYLFNAPPSPDERNHKVRQAMGNGIRPDVWAKFKERFNIPIIDEFYGATETPMVISNHQQGDYGIGSCGHYGSFISKLMEKRFNIAAVDQETQDLWRDPVTGLSRRADVGVPGELLFQLQPEDIKADFQGYTDSKATEEKVARNVFAKGDAWMRTGDLLRRNADNMIFFVDRLGDTFRWKSENVSTNEVEEAISEVPGVAQAVCVGVKVPNHEGRAGFAVVQLEPGASIPNGKELAQSLLKQLPRYAVPIFIKYAKEIQTTGNNKIQKKAFREQKLPSEDETIYWLFGDEYVPLTVEHWDGVENGKHKL